MTASQKNYKLSQSDHDAKSLSPLIIELELEMDIGNGIRIQIPLMKNEDA